MTLYKKVGGGLVQIILFNFWERMTNYKEGGGGAIGSRNSFIYKKKKKKKGGCFIVK